MHSLQVITIPFSAPPHDVSSKQQVRPARACQYLNFCVNAKACVAYSTSQGRVLVYYSKDTLDQKPVHNQEAASSSTAHSHANSYQLMLCNRGEHAHEAGGRAEHRRNQARGWQRCRRRRTF